MFSSFPNISLCVYMHIYVNICAHSYLSTCAHVYVNAPKGHQLLELGLQASGELLTHDVTAGVQITASGVQGIFPAHHWIQNGLCFYLWMNSGLGQYKNVWWGGEMAQLLRPLPALPEDLISTPSTHMADHNCL